MNNLITEWQSRGANVITFINHLMCEWDPLENKFITDFILIKFYKLTDKQMFYLGNEVIRKSELSKKAHINDFSKNEEQRFYILTKEKEVIDMARSRGGVFENWNDVEEVKPFKKIEPGGYIAIIKDCIDVSDRQYYLFKLDILEGEFKGYFQKQYDTWGGNWRCNSYNSYKNVGNVGGMFKAAIKAIEDSNANFFFNLDPDSLKGKKVGILLREEEYEAQDGSIRTALKVSNFVPVRKIINEEYTVPTIKKLDQATSQRSIQVANSHRELQNYDDDILDDDIQF